MCELSLSVTLKNESERALTAIFSSLSDYVEFSSYVIVVVIMIMGIVEMRMKIELCLDTLSR